VEVEFDVPDRIFGHMTRNALRHNGLTRAILVEGMGAAGQNTDVNMQEEDPERFEANSELECRVATPRRALTGSAVEKKEDND
jgi:hypothetical protein